MFPFVLFFYFAALSLAGGITAIFSRNMIYSAIALLVTLIHITGIYILLGAEFVAVVQVLVYAGAILVLYLFVVMLFNPQGEERFLHRHYQVGIFLGFVVLGELLLALLGSPIVQKPQALMGAADLGGNTQAIGTLLYSKYLFPFEIASVILLVAMVGAIVLGKWPRAGEVAQAVAQGTLDQGSRAREESGPPSGEFGGGN